jgi:serine/threonine-protein kinase ATR
LMDHLSKWLRQNRIAKAGATDRTNHVKAVENVLSSIESELMANAALQSKAYARSLRSFEQRIYQQKRGHGRQNDELQEYYERIHQIYAELDEPDGMEGISTFVIAPSLEHQIREHESTGRWTSAQSCWEVRLQQDPDDVGLHVGLLKCLRNLGHYGMSTCACVYMTDW